MPHTGSARRNPHTAAGRHPAGQFTDAPDPKIEFPAPGLDVAVPHLSNRAEAPPIPTGE
jgi:hypothetical protein